MDEEKKFYLSVFACIFNKDLSKILLLKRNKEKREKYGIEWVNIGGKIEFGEFAENACLREIKEEIGLNLDKNRLNFLFVKEDITNYKNSHVAFFIYGAVIDENEILKINMESEDYRWFDLGKLPEKMPDDDIPFIRNMLKEKLNLKTNKNGENSFSEPKR